MPIKGNLLHEGKAKQVYETEKPDQVIMDFKDSLTAGDGVKKGSFQDKGRYCTQISKLLFSKLDESGIPTHYLSELSDRSLLCKKVEILPIEVIVRNIAAGSFCRRYGIKEGTKLKEPLVEFFLKDDSLHDPLIHTEAILALNLATQLELELCRALALKCNTILQKIFSSLNVKLVDMKFEFGKDASNALILADEITPDTMRLWNGEDGRLDKDLFRRDLGGVENAYQKVLSLLESAEYVTERVDPFKIVVEVWPKPSVRDPAGDVTLRSLANLGFEGVHKVRIGRQIHLEFDSQVDFQQINRMISDLLSNELVEESRVRIQG